MISEGESLENTDGPDKLDRAKEAVQILTHTVKETTESVSDVVQRGRRSDAPLDRLARWTRTTPLQALAVAFLLGAVIARRHR